MFKASDQRRHRRPGVQSEVWPRISRVYLHLIPNVSRDYEGFSCTPVHCYRISLSRFLSSCAPTAILEKPPNSILELTILKLFLLTYYVDPQKNGLYRCLSIGLKLWASRLTCHASIAVSSFKITIYVLKISCTVVMASAELLMFTFSTVFSVLSVSIYECRVILSFGAGIEIWSSLESTLRSGIG